ncbi:MAG: glycoside hydrolase family 3 protein [Acidobacteria bacterium]|nr:glycoside hydrolase family 3 protein [Acidobacteriota bacterium]
MKHPGLEKLTTEQKIGRLFFIGISGSELDANTIRLLETVRPGGVCLFARNIKEAGQTRELLDSIRSLLGYEPFLSLDQEGGTVDRLRRIVEPMPAAGSIRSVEDAAQHASIIAQTVRMLGFNLNFAPVVDVATEERQAFSNGLRSRTFGSNADEVTTLAGAFLRTLQAGGCIGCLKHFPGLGGAQVDSHEDLPQVNISEEALYNVELLPYRELFAAGDVKMVMVAHAAFPGLRLQETAQNGRLLPSSLSRAVVHDLLRVEMGFNGIAITDDLEMGAILKGFGIADACRMAVQAGEDMLAICASSDAILAGHAAVSEAFHNGMIELEILDTAVSRIETIRSDIQPVPEFDPLVIEEMSAQVSALKSRLN